MKDTIVLVLNVVCEVSRVEIEINMQVSYATLNHEEMADSSPTVITSQAPLCPNGRYQIMHVS